MARAAERAAQCALLREIFGPLPFRPGVVDLKQAGRDGTAKRLAAALYEERNWQDLPVLADALEDAGGDNAGALGHLRGGGPHLPGCWVEDAVLQRG